jgi:hypothetical protein
MLAILCVVVLLIAMGFIKVPFSSFKILHPPVVATY